MQEILEDWLDGACYPQEGNSDLMRRLTGDDRGWGDGLVMQLFDEIVQVIR